MVRYAFLRLAIVCGFIIPAALSAQTAYTTRVANLRAGPAKDYELVAQIPGDAPVDVHGCVNDWSWCDVTVGPDRGWVYAGNLVYPYEDRRVTILSEGPALGFPIVTFSIGPYWDTYYHGRPWYGRRSYWIGRPAPVFRPGVVARGHVVVHPGASHAPHSVVRQESHARPEAHSPRLETHSPRPETHSPRPQAQRAKPQPARPSHSDHEKPH